MKITETACKTLLVPSSIPGCDLAANPYAGCEHACVYCYAKFMKDYTGHDEEWGDFVDVRVNAADAAIRQMKSGRYTGRTVMVGTVTDPYQQAEKTYRLMRDILPALDSFGLDVSILTKSPLITRDIDILSSMKNVTAGLSITGIDETAREAFEPGAPPYAARIAALERLSSAGISTFVFVAPILPGITDRDFDILLRWIRDSGAREIMFDSLNHASKNAAPLKRAAQAACPASAHLYQSAPAAARALKPRITRFETETNIKCTVFF